MSEVLGPYRRVGRFIGNMFQRSWLIAAAEKWKSSREQFRFLTWALGRLAAGLIITDATCLEGDNRCSVVKFTATSAVEIRKYSAALGFCLASAAETHRNVLKHFFGNQFLLAENVIFSSIPSLGILSLSNNRTLPKSIINTNWNASTDKNIV